MNRKLRGLTLDQMRFNHACLKKEEEKIPENLNDDNQLRPNPP